MVNGMDYIFVFEAVGAVLALAAILYSISIMSGLKYGVPVWVYLAITSFCMFFTMLLGMVGLILPIKTDIQRFQQYIFLLVGAFSFALSGIKLHEILAYSRGEVP
jgi:hypothetical protein